MKLIKCFVALLLSISSVYSQGKILNTTVHSTSLENNFLGDSSDRNVNVYLPPNYDNTAVEYPVVYLLHGYTGNHNLWIGQGYLDIDIKSILDKLIAQEDLQPVIVVMPDGSNKYRGSWYTNSTVTGNWEDFICVDLIEYIDENFRTIKQSESRGISGHSMGGYGAFKLAMKHPEIFSAVFTLSAAWTSFEGVLMGTMKEHLVAASKVNDPGLFDGLVWQEQLMIAGAAAFTPNINNLPFYCEFPVNIFGTKIHNVWEKWLLHDPISLLEPYKNNLSQLNSIWIECGTLDEDFYNANLHLSESLNSIGISHIWTDYIGGHLDKTSSRIEKHMFPFFSNVLVDKIVGIKNTKQIVGNYYLHQNFPNPFNPFTTINYSLLKRSYITLKIFDVLGKEVLELVNREQAKGNYKVEVDATLLSSGVYLYSLQTNDIVETKKMILIK